MRKALHGRLGALVLFGLGAAWAVALAQDPLPGAPLHSMIDRGGEIWTLSPDAFMAKYGELGFAWTSGERGTARAYGEAISFLDLPVPEALVHFEAGQPRELIFVMYNRGDSGDIEADFFEDRVAVMVERMSEWTRVKPTSVADPLKTAGVRREMRVWTCEPSQFRLEWSTSSGAKGRGFGGSRPEYLRVRCQAMAADRDYRSALRSMTASRQKAVSVSALKSNVKTDHDGDVWIDGIPMVDQGEKGYCAAATTERILRYYGRDVDQHQLAQMAQSSASMGTDPRTLVDVLRKLGIGLGCKIEIHEDFDVNRFLKLVDRYNRAGRGRGKPAIEPGKTIDINRIYLDMDTDVLREVRQSQKTEFKGFVSTVDKYIRQGIPLCWSVVVGKVPETPALTGTGGHMRIIFGLNAKQSELLYTDSWGPGHERKRLSLGDAWLITQGLYTIEPRLTMR